MSNKNKEEVFNIFPEKIITILYHKKYDNYYDFLNYIETSKNINIKKYYDLINSFDFFELNSLYQFIFLKIIKLNKIDNNLKLLETNFKINNPYYFNKVLKEYINNNLLRSIIIINCIQQYFIPIKH